MKKFKTFGIITSVLIIGLVVMGCPNPSSGGNNNSDTPDNPDDPVDPTYYIVTFNSNGGSAVDAIPVESGNTITLPAEPARDYHTFGGWYIDNSFANAFTASTVVSTDITVYAKWREYVIGDIGPAGGLIFYDKGSVSDGWRMLEAAPKSTEFSSVYWGLYGIEVPGTQKGIGTGKENTRRILEVLEDRGETGKAAQLCDTLDVNNIDDWFLPSINELDLIYTNLVINNLGDFDEQARYWASSQDDRMAYVQYNPWFREFNQANGAFTDMDGGPQSVRAVRQF
jgi:uncharacterized repeat protein (TIGR02543 family)